MKTAEYVNRFGVQAIFGRQLYLHEIKEMVIAENVFNAYMERQGSGNWAEWAEKNPTMSEVLVKAARYVEC